MALKDKGSPAQARREEAAKVYAEEHAHYGLRLPKGPSEFDVFLKQLSDEMAPWARPMFQMACEHEWETVTNRPDGSALTIRCERCEKMMTYGGTVAKTKRDEWLTYVPPGFDWFDWEELYVRDKSMWCDIFEEALYEMEPKIGGNDEQA